MMRASSFVGLVVAIYALSMADAWAVAAVPEPASMSLLAVGLGAFAIARLRRKK